MQTHKVIGLVVVATRLGFNMEWVLLGMIITIIVVGLTFARSTQDYIDEQNQRYREEKKNARTK